MIKNKLTLKLGTLLLTTFSTLSAFAVDPLNLIRTDYQYYDDDIRTIIQTRLDGANVDISPAFQLENINNLRGAIVNPAAVRANTAPTPHTSLIPLNLGGGHWVALAIKKNADNSVIAIYTDSVGTALNSQNAAKVAILRAELNAAGITDANIYDLQLHQQSGGVACGAFTAENLIAIANNDFSGLNADQIKAIIARNVGTDQAIRRQHFLSLYGNTNTTDITTLKPRSEVAANKFSSQNRTLTNSMNNVTKLLNDRLINASNFSAVAAGDDEPKFGVWVKGIMGVGSDEDGTNSTNSENKSSSKSSFRGIILGADAEIMEDLTVGLAFSRIDAKVKYKLQYVDTNKDKITNNIYSLYGSNYLTDDILLNASIAVGKVTVKSQDYLLSGGEIKQKGTLLSGSVATNYKLYSDEKMAATPRISINYNSFNLGGYERNSIKVLSNKQRSVDAGVGTDFAFMHRMGGMRVTPKVSLDYSRVVWSNGSKLTITNINGANIINKKVVVDKNIFKAGAGITVEATNNVEVSTGYEFSGQGKSTNHLGYAKLRLNF